MTKKDKAVDFPKMSPCRWNVNIFRTNSFVHKNLPELSSHLKNKPKNVYNPNTMGKLFSFVVIEQIIVL